jgi:hypothetical protein
MRVWEEAAADFMRRKGCPDAMPAGATVEGLNHWLVDYDLDGGLLTLDVAWDSQTRSWSVKVDDYYVPKRKGSRR